MKTCAIVNAYSSGKLLAPAFAEEGYRVIHVKEHWIPLDEHSFHEEDFFLNIPQMAPEMQAEILARNGTEFVLPGAESGVERADLLNNLLGTKGNGIVLSSARRDKYEMIETVRKAGLRAARQVRASAIEPVLAFANSLTEFDIILKPLRSTGSNLVFRANDEQEARYAFEQIISTPTMLGDINTEICAQEFLKGEEFVVNTVSRDGEHTITDLWKCHLTSGNGMPFLYDYNELLDFHDPEAEPLKTYTLDTLDALGIKWGPAHPEIMSTPDGPVVIEVGARLSGANFPVYAQAAIGRSQVSATVAAYCGPSSFDAMVRIPYSLTKRCVVVSLISEVRGKLESLSRMGAIERLESFFDASIWIKEGELIERTVDVATVPGVIALIHEDPAVIRRDYEVIRELEHNGLYEVG